VPVETVLIKRRRNLLLRLQLTFNKTQVHVEVFADSSYAELARIALRKIGLKLSDKNVSTMRSKIEQTIGAFVEQLSRSIQAIQEQSKPKTMQSWPAAGFSSDAVSRGFPERCTATCRTSVPASCLRLSLSA